MINYKPLTKLENVPIGTKAKRALRAAGLLRVRDVAGMTDTQLGRIMNFDRDCLMRLRGHIPGPLRVDPRQLDQIETVMRRVIRGELALIVQDLKNVAEQFAAVTNMRYHVVAEEEKNRG